MKCKHCNRDLVEGKCANCDPIRGIIGEELKSQLAPVNFKLDKKDIARVTEGKDTGWKRVKEMLMGMKDKDYARVKEHSGAADLTDAEKGIGGADPLYLLPQEYVGTIYALIQEYGIAAKDCQIVETTAPAGRLPRLTDTPQTHWVGSSGVIANGWEVRGRIDQYGSDADTDKVLYGQRKPTVSVGFDGVPFEIKENVGILPIPLSLIDDTHTDMETLLTRLFVNAALEAQDNALISGVAYPGAVTMGGLDDQITAVTDVAAANAPTLIELLRIQGLVTPTSAATGAKYYMSNSVKTYFDALRLALNPASLKLDEILGYPVEITAAMPTMQQIEDGGDGFPFAIFGNLKNTYLIQRKQLTIDTSTEATIVDADDNIQHVLFQDNMLAIRLTQRLDIRVMSAAAYSKLDNI